LSESDECQCLECKGKKMSDPYPISRLQRPKGTVIRRTDILCDYCKKDNFVVEEPGSETPRWLRCHICDQYYYVVFGVLCANVIMLKGGNLSKEKVERELAKE
jgi:hypothetical protein